MKRNPEQKTEETLAAFDGLQRAEAPPFLYSKIRTRMQGAAAYVPQSLAWRLVAALVVVAVVNVFTLRQFKTAGEGGPASVASEYNIALPQTY